MKEASNQETKKVWNIKNLILNGIHVLVIAITLWVHPMLETKPVGALP